MDLAYAVTSALHALKACGRQASVRNVEAIFRAANGGHGLRSTVIREALKAAVAAIPKVARDTPGTHLGHASTRNGTHLGLLHARDLKVRLDVIDIPRGTNVPRPPEPPPDVDFAELEDDVAGYVALAAAENKSGKITPTRVLTIRRELYAEIDRAPSRAAFAHGLRTANAAGAPNPRYVRKAAAGYSRPALMAVPGGRGADAAQAARHNFSTERPPEEVARVWGAVAEERKRIRQERLSAAEGGT